VNPRPSADDTGQMEEEARARDTRARAGRLPRSLRQFVKFAVVGGTGTLVNLVVFSAIIYAWRTARGDRPLVVEQVASGVAFCVAVVNNFVLNRAWTFHHSGPLVRRFGRFFVISLLGLGLNVLVFSSLRKLGIEAHVSQFLAILVVTPFNFLGSKLWAFR
jgi:putative flippase GtrA